MAPSRVARIWRVAFPGKNPGLWWRSLLSSLAWTAVLMIVGAFTHDEGWAAGVYQMALAGFLVWAATAFFLARAPRRRGWGSYVAIGGTFAWIIGASVVFGTRVSV